MSLGRKTTQVNIDDFDSFDKIFVKNGEPFYINPRIPYHFVQDKKSINKNIAELRSYLKNRKLKFKIFPTPPCITSSSKVNKPLFQIDEGFVYYSAYKLPDSGKRLSIAKICMKCDMLGKKCSGIKFMSHHTKSAPEIERWSEEFMKDGLRILDIGCGCNSILFRFINKTRRKPAVHCLDPYRYNMKMLFERVKKYYPRKSYNLFSLIGMGESLPFRSKVFDAVILKSSYNHLLDLQKTFKDVRRILNSNGKIYIFEEYFRNREVFSLKDKNKIGIDELMELIINQTEFRNHNLKKALSEVERDFHILDKFEHKENFGSSWGIKAEVGG